MSEKLSVTLNIDEITALVLQHSRLAMQARKMAEEYDKLAQVYLEAGKRFRREKEEQESKMNIRKIISGVSVLLLIVMVCGFALSSQPRTLAQDVPAVTATVAASINGNPVEATLEPVQPTPADTTTSVFSIVLDKLGEFVLIIAVVALAFKTGSLIPADTVDKVLARGFDLAIGLADSTSTPVDNEILGIAKPIVLKWVTDELAKRDAVQSTLQPPININVQSPSVSGDDLGAALIDAAKNNTAGNP